MRDDRPTISEAEWEVMDRLWERAPQTSAELVEALAADDGAGTASGRHPKTVRTLLGRLVKKGHVATRDDGGGRYLYTPTVSRRECVRREGRSFVERVFGGDPASLLLHFVDEAELSREQIEELERRLDERKEVGR